MFGMFRAERDVAKLPAMECDITRLGPFGVRISGDRHGYGLPVGVAAVELSDKSVDGVFVLFDTTRRVRSTTIPTSGVPSRVSVGSDPFGVRAVAHAAIRPPAQIILCLRA